MEKKPRGGSIGAAVAVQDGVMGVALVESAPQEEGVVALGFMSFELARSLNEEIARMVELGESTAKIYNLPR